MHRCNEESKPIGKIDVEVYDKLAKLDARLGLTVPEQLIGCLYLTTRVDIIQVSIYNTNFALIFLS